MITGLYIASGLIGSNPSAIGGTYAWRTVSDDGQCDGRGAVLSSSQVNGEVTNNQAEMMALLEGLKRLPADFNGAIYSVSRVTLGRAFNGWRWRNIPAWMHETYRQQRARLTNWNQINYVLLEGQNEHHQWCEQACRVAGDVFLAVVEQNIPTTQDVAAYV